MKKMRPRLTFANVISCLALFVALGGSAYAATQLKKNSVGSKQLKKNAVTPVKLSAAAKETLKGVPGAQGLTGKEGPPGKEGAQGPSDLYSYSEESEQVVRESPEMTIGSLTVPPGQYLLNASLATDDEAAAGIVCWLISGETGLDYFDESLEGIYEQGSIAGEASVAVTEPTVISIICHASGTNFMRVYQTKLTALKVGAIHSS